MREILLIRGADAVQVLDVLAVAAELTRVLGDNTQVDVAVPAAHAEYALLSNAVRRVIPVAPPDTGSWEDFIAGIKNDKNDGSDGGGGGTAAKWGRNLLMAAKKISAVAGQNMKSYWHLVEELRVTQYDVAFDFDFSPFSVAVNKAAKTTKVIGFDAKYVSNALPGAALTAHETFAITGEMSRSSRMRHLAARYFNYRAAKEQEQIDWCLRLCEAPAAAPPPPYIIAGGNIPSPFVSILQQHELSLMQVEQDHSFSPAELTGLVQAAEMAIGNGIISALAAAAGIKNLFIGSPQETPQQALCIETPTALSDALLPATALPEAVQTPDAVADDDSNGGAEQPSSPGVIKLKKDDTA